MRGSVRAFIYFNVTPGKEEQFLKKLMEYDEVIEAHLITGEYDVLAVLQFKLYGRGLYTSAQDVVGKFVLNIRKLREVQDTNTIVPTISLSKRE